MSNVTLRENQKEMLGFENKVKNGECITWVHK